MTTEEILAELKMRTDGLRLQEKIRKSVLLMIKQFVRYSLGWAQSLPQNQRTAINDRAGKAVDNICKGKETDLNELTIEMISPLLLGQYMPVFNMVKESKRRMEKLVKSLPIWTCWAKDIHGVGPLNLAKLLGATGNPSDYPDPAKLRKRMGLAPWKDGLALGTFRPEGEQLTKDEWKDSGYNKNRRCVSFLIGDSFVRSNGNCPYRQIYSERKVYEQKRALRRGIPIVPTAEAKGMERGSYFTKEQIHLRAQRVAEQKFLKHFWMAWRKLEGLPVGDEHTSASEVEVKAV